MILDLHFQNNHPQITIFDYGSYHAQSKLPFSELKLPFSTLKLLFSQGVDTQTHPLRLGTSCQDESGPLYPS